MNRTPEEDFAIYYFSSGKLSKRFKLNPEKFHYRIHYTFDTKQEACDFEFKILGKVYKRNDWANQSKGKLINFSEDIKKSMKDVGERLTVDGITLNKYRGMLSAETRVNTVLPDGKTIAESAALKSSETMENTIVDGETIHQKRIRKAHKTKSEVQESGLTLYQESGIKGSITKTKIDKEGFSIAQRAAMKNPCCQKGTKESSDIGAKRDAKYTKKLQDMSNAEFDSWCEGRTKGVISGAITRRNKIKLTAQE